MRRPIIGLTMDVDSERFFLRRPYVRAVVEAGGLPLLLPPAPETAPAALAACDAVILTGGDDPIMEVFGRPSDPRITPIDPDRQVFELALLDLLAGRVERPTLGVCLGMQLMALHAGGDLDQHLPDSLPTHADHWGRRVHPVSGAIGAGDVLSHHRQAVRDPGSLEVIATAHDGVIEAVRDNARPFYVGVQWHPERTDDTALGLGLFRDLVRAAAAYRATVTT